MSLLSANPVYKPFHYPWAYDAWLQQQRIHWLPEEVPLADDVKDWQKILTDKERNLLTQIFRFLFKLMWKSITAIWGTILEFLNLQKFA